MLGLSDRVMVMAGGRIIGEMSCGRTDSAREPVVALRGVEISADHPFVRTVAVVAACPA